MIYYSNPGGVCLKSGKLTVLCSCAEEGRPLEEMIQSSFLAFIKKELRNAEEPGSRPGP